MIHQQGSLSVLSTALSVELLNIGLSFSFLSVHSHSYLTLYLLVKAIVIFLKVINNPLH